MGYVLPNVRPERSKTMKKRVFVALALALIWIALPVMSALAGDIFRFRGKSADAFFSSTDGCNFTNVGVFATDARVQSPPGPGNTSSEAFVSIFKFTVCPDFSPLVDAFGFVSLADPDFQVLGQINSATLNTTMEVFDFVSFSSFNVDVDLTWTGTGAVSRSNSHFHFQSPGFIVNGHFNGASRFAVASGSVSAMDTNFTPDPSMFGQIISAKSGQVIID
jgi:hypothetical protein